MKFHVQNFNGVFDDIIPHIDCVNTIEEADRVLVWQDILKDIADEIKIAQSKGKKVIQMSHCFGSCNDYSYPENHKSISDKILVWGQYDYNLAMQAGIAHKVVVTGNPIFNHRKEKKSDGKTIIYSPAHFVDGDKRENHLLAMVLEDYTVISKLVDGHEVKEYPNPIVSNRREKNHIDICFEVLSKADVVVVNDSTSTFALLAMSMDIPVIFVNQYRTDYGLQNNTLKSGEYQTTIEHLPVLLDRIFENDTKREQRRLWADYCGAFIEDPLSNILKEINN